MKRQTSKTVLLASRIRILSDDSVDTKDEEISGKNQTGHFSRLKSSSVQIVWRNVLIMTYIHIGAAVGLYHVLFTVSWKTVALEFLFGYLGAFGITVGAHRLWAHKAYKAKLPLRILLVYMQTVACQNSIHEWCRDHRVHHKFTETNADPHNAKRGFFFAHFGWLLCKKHGDVKAKGKSVDMSDLEDDPIVMFQKKFYIPLVLLVSFIIPTAIPYYLWTESGFVCWCVSLFRYAVSLHATWLVNSAAHLWGQRPYDKNINPSENKIVSLITNGEGWHNYHHIFPWDYKAAELGMYKYNLSTALIDFFAWIGWAYDLKTVPEKVVLSRVARTGDGSHLHSSVKDNDADMVDQNMNTTTVLRNGHSWGWDDSDTPKEDREVTVII